MAYEQYLSSGMHIGMKQQTKDMKRFVYKVRDDGLAVLDLQTIEKRIKIAAKFLMQYKNIMSVSRKNLGFKAVTKFAEITDSKANKGRFLPGTITNPSFRGYYEPEVLIVVDPSIDRQAMIEAVKMRIPIIALSGTINETNMIDFIIPVNNRGRKAIAMVFYLLAKELLTLRGVDEKDMKFTPEDFESSQQ